MEWCPKERESEDNQIEDSCIATGLYMHHAPSSKLHKVISYDLSNEKGAAFTTQPVLRI